MNTRISGIPCEIEVTYYAPPRSMSYDKRDGTWAPPEPEEIEFRVLDRRGRHAPWLEEKLTEDDRIRIEEELREDWREQMAEAIVDMHT